MDVSIFSVLGPVMIGPSSSHTAGAARLSRAAAGLRVAGLKRSHLGCTAHLPKRIKDMPRIKRCLPGCWAWTNRMRISSAVMNWLTSRGLKYEFYTTDLGDVHESR